MHRLNFAKSSGAIMDVCKSDGARLDQGELQRIVGFVEKGGMSNARQRDRERLIDEQRRLTAMQTHASASLIVRAGQAAVLVDQGVVADVFEPGRHEPDVRR